ncbi:unnamed protein product, partial [Staurois parvus]
VFHCKHTAKHSHANQCLQADREENCLVYKQFYSPPSEMLGNHWRRRVITNRDPVMYSHRTQCKKPHTAHS